MDRTLYWLWLAEALGSACRYTGELLAEWPDPRDLDRAVRAGQPLPACVSPKAAEKLRAAEHGGQQEAGGAGGQRLPSFQFYGKLSTLQGLSTSQSFFLIVAERRQKARRKSAVE